MDLTRRQILAAGSGTVAAAGLTGFLGLPDEARAAGSMTLHVPDVIEAGHKVPITVTAPGAVAVTLLTDRGPTSNPASNLAIFRFASPRGACAVSTQLYLSCTQTVIAVAEMEDGSIQQTQARVTVKTAG